jgi:glycosyltransferase involved in cell wall biosynthesis
MIGGRAESTRLPQGRCQVKLSVVVCTRNRGAQVLQTVESILRNPGDDWELIIVDQSATNDTEHALEAAGLLADPRFVYQRTATIGLSRARNEGIRRARGEIIAFTDDDCLVPVTWVHDLMQRYEEQPEMAMLYAAVVASAEAEKGWIPEFYPLEEGFVRRVPRRVIRSLGIGANFSLRRSTMEAIGPFDVFLGPGGALGYGEDVDFGYRALRHGLKVYTAHEPAVLHCGLRQGADISALGARYLEGMSLICMKQARCGDISMLVPVAREFWMWFAAGTANLVRGRRPSGYRAANGVLRGVMRSFRCAVDTRQRLYRPWRAAASTA